MWHTPFEKASLQILDILVLYIPPWSDTWNISHYSFIIYVQIYLSFILAGMECEYFAKTDRWLVWLFGMLKESIEQKFISCNTEISQEYSAISRSAKTAGVNTEDELLEQHWRPLIEVGQSGR